MPQFINDNNNTVKASALKPGASFVTDNNNTAKNTPWIKASQVSDTNPDQKPTVWKPSCPVPVASFTASDLTPVIGVPVVFTDTSTNNPTSWLWDFGDGTTSTLQNPSHTYSAIGDYDVTLTVSNECGDASADATDTVSVSGDPSFASVIYLLDGTLESGRVVDQSSYNARFTFVTDKFSQSSDVPSGFTGYSLRRNNNNTDSNPLILFSGGPLGQTLDGDTWTIEWWYKAETNSKTRMITADVSATGSNQVIAGHVEDVFPVIRRISAFNNPNVYPGVINQSLEPFPFDQWRFYAAVCQNSVISVYQGSTPGGSATRVATYSGSGSYSGTITQVDLLAGDPSTGSGVGTASYITQLRYTNGVARGDPSSTTYPIPAGPFPQE